MAILKIIDNESFMPDFGKNIHYITWTPSSDWPMSYNGEYVPYSGLSYPFAVIGSVGVDPIPIFSMVDRNCETGTLYPEFNITIMPSGVFEDGIIYKHFADAVAAQEIIRAHNVLFDYRFYRYISPYTGKADDLAYLKMLEYNKNRFDFDNIEAKIYLLVAPNNIIASYTRELYKSEDYFADESEVASLKRP